MRPRVVGLWISFVFLVCLGVTDLNAAIIQVPFHQPTIPAAFNAAASGDTVLVAPGTYSFNLTFGGKSVRIASSHGPEVTFLKQAVLTQPLISMRGQETANAQLSGFTIADAYGPNVITIEGGAIPVISNNIFHHFRGNGSNATVIMCNAANPLITHNIFYDNSGISCIGIWGGSVRIINNTFDHNARGFFNLGNQGVVLNNIVTNSANYGIDGRFTTLDYNDVWSNGTNYQGNALPGPGSIQADPMFEDVAARNYLLQRGSPCVDAGDPNPLYNDPDDSRSDMGAHSFAMGLPPIARQVRFNPSRTPGVIYSPIPLFVWQYRDESPSVQQAYELEVGTDPRWEQPPLWQSGQVISSDTQSIYTGPALSDHAEYWFRIRLANATQWGDWLTFSFRVHIDGPARVPGEFASIQQAIEAVADHDTVLVESGVYNVSLDFRGRPIVLKSESGAATTRLRPYLAETPIIRFVTAEPNESILDGFTLSGTSQTCLIQINGASPIIRNNIIADYTNSTGSAALMTRSGDPFITRNQFCYCAGNGAITVESGNCTIINNTFDSNSRAINSSGTTIAFNNIISNSTKSGIGGSYFRQEFNNIWNNTIDYWNGALPGNGNLSVDPTYHNMAIRDYGLTINSPCVNAGDPDSIYMDPDGSRNDLGVFPLYLDSTPRAVRLTVSPRSSTGNVVSLIPTFGWQFIGLMGSRQQAVEIEVGTNTDWSVAETWQSGTILTESMQLALDGAPLTNNTVYHYRVRVSDGVSWGGWSSANFRVRLPRSIHVPAQFGTINGAISAAQTDDSVIVAPGSYAIVTTIDFQSKGIILMSSGGPFATILRAPTATPTVHFSRAETRASVLSGFTFEGGSNLAIMLSGTAEPTITNNIFRNFKGWATIENNSSLSPLVANNIFYNNYVSVSVVDYNGSMQVVNNTFDKNYGGLWTASERTVAVNNIFTRTTMDAIGGTFARQEYNLVWNNGTDYSDGAFPGQGNISVDPKFVSDDGQEYCLSYNSPCINAGAPDLELVDPDDTRSDIGAIPFLSTNSVHIRHLTIDAEDLQRVASPAPRFIWGQHSPTGDVPFGYRIQVGTDLNWTVAEMWSKEVIGRTDTFAVYAGAPLQQGKTYWMRIQVTDGAEWSEWSDWRQLWFRMNTLPTPPVPRSPLNYILTGDMPWLSAKVPGDVDQDEVTIDFVFCTDSLLTDQVLLVEDAPFDTWDSIAYCKPDLVMAENAGLFWSARAWDGHQYSAWGTPTRIWYNHVPESPGPLGLLEPQPHISKSLPTLAPKFSWSRSLDPDPGDTVRYSLEVAIDPLFEYLYAEDSLLDTTCILPFLLQVNRQYWWRVTVADQTNLSMVSDSGTFWTWKQGDVDLSLNIDIHDLSMMISYMADGLDVNIPEHVGDCSGDCRVDLTDLSQLIAYMSALQVRFGTPCVNPATGELFQSGKSWPGSPDTEQEPMQQMDTTRTGLNEQITPPENLETRAGNFTRRSTTSLRKRK